MSTPHSVQPRERGIHPLVATAAVCVILFSGVAVAAVLGWLPTPWARGADNPAIESAATGKVPPEAPKKIAAASTTTTPAKSTATGSSAPAKSTSTGTPAAGDCAACGVVERVREVRVPSGQRRDSNNIIGTVAGGVAGGVIGNQFGGGSGRDALTVVGAIGGALAGREIQDRVSEQPTVIRYETTVKMSDGSTRTFNGDQVQFASGDHVRIENNQLRPR
ncbi:glycine zipper 2TM domain-containing protein [Alcaligenaceae bacterium A4P071]|nr:glycine zipper 2TM domain-containing protein [Alcaligenaceae bacterium B3P038]MDQ2149212.1 glycine zipper 2TM domain-containing protein [Alcaligenaceae bacterium C4P045]MDQ2186488.1 glycine zipper 2TM domain-containing protein [Alcaligenaceae bacterium A4P071]